MVVPRFFYVVVGNAITSTTLFRPYVKCSPQVPVAITSFQKKLDEKKNTLSEKISCKKHYVTACLLPVLESIQNPRHRSNPAKMIFDVSQAMIESCYSGHNADLYLLN